MQAGKYRLKTDTRYHKKGQVVDVDEYRKHDGGQLIEKGTGHWFRPSEVEHCGVVYLRGNDEPNEQVGPQQPAQEVMRRIPVGKKLPPFDEEVFIKNKADGWMKGRLDRIDIAGNRFITPKYDAAGCNTHYDITHWLPLSVLDEYFK